MDMRVPPPARRPGLGLAFRFALREMRGGLRGFWIFLGCLSLGVAAIVAVNAVASAIQGGIASRGQTILGGDLALSAVQRELPAPVAEQLGRLGTVSRSASLRGMARRPDGADQVLVELKAVDAAYPLYGTLRGADGPLDPAALAGDGVFVDPLLLERLGLKIGDTLSIGRGAFRIAGAIVDEPDRLGEGMVFGPRVLMTQAGLEASGLVQPGTLVRNGWAVRLSDPSTAGLERAKAGLEKPLEDEGFRLRDRLNAAPSLSENVGRFAQFLTLVGLTALVVGGVGVANSVRAYLATRREPIATLKSLGAPGGFVFTVYLIQIMLMATAGIAIGIAVGLVTPLIAGEALRGLLPFDASAAFSLRAVGLGIAFGYVTAFVFAAWPLGLARETPAAALFRSADFSGRAWPRPFYLVLIAAGLATLIALALLMSDSQRVAGTFLAGIAGAFVLLRLVAWAIAQLAARAPRPASTPLRLALGNIHRPGALTPSVVLSLGLGLALIAALTLIDLSLRRQVSGRLPAEAPSFFFVDVQAEEREAFLKRLGELAPQGLVEAVPMLRGRITRLNDTDAEDWPAEEGRWVLSGDRGVTYAPTKPDNATLVEGSWWAPDHAGPPLMSFSEEEARELGLKLGDTVTVNVLGRPVTATIANLRRVEWETLGINFVMVFSPDALAGAPHIWLATLTFPGGAKGDPARDAAILKALTTDFPTVTAVPVSDALEAVNTLIGQLALAIRAASGVALAASALVLAGGLAAGNRARARDAVILKTLGARRRTILAGFLWEYGLLGLATALFALAAGWLAAWYVVERIMQLDVAFSAPAALGVIGGALVVTVGLGLAGTWAILGQKAAPVLREL